MRADLRTLTTDLQEQWDLLRAWLSELPEDIGPRPSPLPGWTVGEVIAHLGRTLAALSACRPAPPDVEPMSLSDYLAGYSHHSFRAVQIARNLSADLAEGRLAALDDIAEKAFAQLRRLDPERAGDAVVVGLRGPILLRDMLTSRLAELVIHAEDLAPLLPLPVPVDPTARILVAEALLEVLRRRTGADVEIGDARAWVLLAAGRLTWAQGIQAGALRPRFLGDGLPDLSEALPIF